MPEQIALEEPAVDDEEYRPPTDLVARRLVVKWEPLMNVTHRYVFCRCVLRRSTPSWLYPEATMLICAACPRHNSVGIYFRDYGDIDYHRDPYFNQFGGYDAFRLLVQFSVNHDCLGVEKFLPHNAMQIAGENLVRYLEEHRETFESMKNRYLVEIGLQMKRSGLELPERLDDLIKTAEEPQGERSWGLELAEQVRRSPMMMQVKEVLAGKYSGQPHWTVKG